MKNLLKSLICVLLPLLTSHSHASLTNEEIGYETIVQELSKSRVKVEKQAPSRDPFALVKIHTGIGFTQSLLRVRKNNGDSVEGFNKGIQASLGIDLFSKNWFAEAVIRSFGDSEFDDNIIVQLKEFDLKVVYRSNPHNTFGFRTGLGLASRNISITELGSERSFSTPSSILLLGLDTNISEMLTIGGEFSYRSSFTSESDDRVAMDFALKIDAHF